MSHKYTEKYETARFTVEISPSTCYGYFESTEGEGGGLWFSKNKILMDYDGVSSLPVEVAAMIHHLGYKVENEFIEDWGKRTRCERGRVKFNPGATEKPWICFIGGHAMIHQPTWSEVVSYFKKKGMKI